MGGVLLGYLDLCLDFLFSFCCLFFFLLPCFFLAFFLCPIKGGASGETRGLSLCPIRSGAVEDRSSFIASVGGSALALSAEPIDLKEVPGGGGGEVVVVVPKYPMATVSWKAGFRRRGILTCRSSTTVGRPG